MGKSSISDIVIRINDAWKQMVNANILYEIKSREGQKL